ncbi:MAG: cupin domain-containing protein, partial [Oscillospiraceae bacterium]
QNHPMHYHKVKEETFQVLYGDLECVIDGQTHNMKAGDIQTVLRNSPHSFSSKHGAVFEEVSTTHIKGDSYYEDPAIAKLDLIERKTIIENW